MYKDSKNKQKLLKDIVIDERFKVIDLELRTEAKTAVFPGSKISSNRKETLEIAGNLNKRNVSVYFLPESDTQKSADAIIEYKGRLIIADLKYSNTLKIGTLKKDLINGFEKSQMVVLKLRNADTSILAEAIDELARKEHITGDLMLINRLGKEEIFRKRELKSGKYLYRLRGFL